MKSSDSLCPFGLPRGCSHSCQLTTFPRWRTWDLPASHTSTMSIMLHLAIPTSQRWPRPFPPNAVLPSTNTEVWAIVTRTFRDHSPSPFRMTACCLLSPGFTTFVTSCPAGFRSGWSGSTFPCRIPTCMACMSFAWCTPYRTPKMARERNDVENGAGSRRNRKYTKATRDVVRN